MTRDDTGAGEPYVLIEEQSSEIGPFLLGIALGAGLALLLAPRSGVETRNAIRRRVRSAQDAARDAAGGVADRVSDTFTEAREELERRIESARAAVSMRTRQLADAVSAGREAARVAEDHARSRFSYSRGGQATRPGRQSRPTKSESPSGRRAGRPPSPPRSGPAQDTGEG
jgi:gas vesicle protein